MAITGRRPAFVALCALTLTLSVGANLAVFTVVNAIWLRPRPVADPDRLVVITNLSAAGGPRPIDMVKSAELGDFARTPVFEGVTGQLAPGELLGDHFRAHPVGKLHVQICRAEACRSMNGDAVAQLARERFRVEFGETRADGAVTLDEVYCLGLCACAPSAMFNGEPVGNVDAQALESRAREHEVS